MDRTGCPPGYATDHVFMYGDDYVPGSCTANFTLFVVIMSILSLLRVLLACLQIHQWIKREMRRSLDKVNPSRRRTRIPMIPIFSTIIATSVTVFTILVSLNVANASNGIPAFLLGLFYFPVALTMIIICLRIVRMGRSVIPLSKKTLDSKATDNSSARDKLQNLEKVDNVLKVCFVVSFAAGLVLLPGSLMIAVLITPAFVPLQIGMLTFCVFDWIIPAMMAYQLQRLINAIKDIQKDGHSDEEATPKGQRAVDGAIRKMRILQVGLFGTCLVASITWLVNGTGIVPPYYWFSFLYFGFEIIAAGPPPIYAFFRGQRRPRTKVTNSRDNNVVSQLVAVANGPATYSGGVATSTLGGATFSSQQ